MMKPDDTRSRGSDVHPKTTTDHDGAPAGAVSYRHIICLDFALSLHVHRTLDHMSRGVCVAAAAFHIMALLGSPKISTQLQWRSFIVSHVIIRNSLGAVKFCHVDQQHQQQPTLFYFASADQITHSGLGTLHGQCWQLCPRKTATWQTTNILPEQIKTRTPNRLKLNESRYFGDSSIKLA